MKITNLPFEPVPVDLVGTAIVPGTGATNLGKAEDAAHTTGDTGVMVLAVRQDSLSVLAANGDYIPLVVDASGRLYVAPLQAGTAIIGSTMDGGPSWTSVTGVSNATVVSADASGAAAAVTAAPTAGQKLVIDDLIISVGAALTVTITEETSGTVKGKYYMAANSTIQITPRGKMKLDTADKKLMVQTSGAGNIGVTTLYHSES